MPRATSRSISRRRTSAARSNTAHGHAEPSLRPDGGPMLAPEIEPAPATLASAAPASGPREIDGRIWSGYQCAIFDDVASGIGDTVVRARAGTGKTTTIVQALKSVPAGLSVAFFAFNKSIATELQSRAPAGVEVSTLHSFGFSAVRYAFCGVRVDAKKLDRIVTDFYGTGRETVEIRNAVSKIVAFAKGNLCHEAAEIGAMIDAMIDAGQLEWPNDPGLTMDRLVQESAQILSRCKSDTRSIDFDDMIWFPCVHDLACRQFDRIFVDETQDLNRAQITLAMKARKANGRICAVGDDRQAIYAFRGADSNALDNVARALGAKVLPLSITYRCASSIVDVAKQIVPDYEAAPNAPAGLVEQRTVEQLKTQVKPGDFVISRTNAPLVGICLSLLRAGIPATVAGRDIGANLISLVRKTKAVDVGDLAQKIDEWAKAEIERLSRRVPPPEAAIESVNDRAECINAIAEGAASVDDVIRKIEGLFSDTDDSRRVVCTTTHKAKGLERDRAWMLSWTYKRGKNTEEDNLYYVAVTRARRELYTTVR